MTHATETAPRTKHKPKLRWSLPDSARPTPELLRRIPELEGIENNPWYRLLLAGRARRLATASRTKSLVVTSAGLILVPLLLTAYALWSLPFFWGMTSIHTSLWPTFFFGVASYVIGGLVLMECFGLRTSGLVHPLAIAFGFAREPMRDLVLARNDPREIAQACFGSDCVPFTRFRWVVQLAWLTPMSCIFAALCTWRFRGETTAQLAIVPPMLIAGYGWGLLPHAERVLLHHAARLRSRKAEASTDPLATLAIIGRKIFVLMLRLLWKTVAIYSVSYVFLFLIEESNLLSPEAEVLPGLVAWPLYAYWLMLAAFIYGLIQTIYSSKLAPSNLDRLATNAPAIMQKLFPDDIEPDPPAAKPPRRSWRRTPLRTPREFLRWLFRTPVPLSAFGTITRAVRVSLCSICLLFSAIMVSPPGSILAWFDRSDANYVWDTWKRGYSFSDIEKRYKWQRLDVTVALRGNAQATRRISISQTGSNFGWIDDFQHLLTAQTKLRVSLSAPPPSREALAKLLSNPGIRRALSEFQYDGYSIGIRDSLFVIDTDLDFSKMERLQKLVGYPISVTKSLRLPSSLKSLQIGVNPGLDRIWINANDSKLRRITLNSSMRYAELQSFLSQNPIETAHLSFMLPYDCSDLEKLNELLRCRSLSMWIGSGNQSLKGIDTIPKLEAVDIHALAVDDLPLLAKNLPLLLKCPNLKSLSLSSWDPFSPVSQEMMPTLRQLGQLERLEISTSAFTRLRDMSGMVLDKPSPTYPKPQPFFYSEYRRPRITTEAAYIEAQVRWPEALEKAVQKIDDAIEAERKLAETPVTDETAAQILWPNASPQTSP